MKAPFNTSILPQKPGIYQYYDSEDTIIYIGKAKNIKKRVSSYFTKDQSLKTDLLVQHIARIEYIITPSEVEALLLESELIRKHKPKYNIDLKHNVRYAWVVLTDEKFPRLLTARNKKIKGEYFGPFVNGQHRRTLIQQLQKRFFIRTCRTLPKKECLRYHMGICKAPCISKQSVEEYNKEIEKVRRYLRGKNTDLVKDLKKEMHEASDKLEFEEAQTLKEQINTLEFLQDQLLVKRGREYEEDVINYITKQNNLRLQIFSYRNGVLQGKENFTVPKRDEAIDEFLKRYYELTPPPRKIILPEEPEDKALAEYLSKATTYTVKFIVPKQGVKKQLLNLAMENLLSEDTEVDTLAREIQELLQTPKPVYTIDCFDISHHSGTSMVGSMVHFKNGKPLKSKYRRFKITTVVDTVDDFRAMEEVVGRRYKRAKDGTMPAPDLIVIDGGRIQVDFAMKALTKLGLDIPLVGLAKKFEEIYYPGEAHPMQYDKKSKAMRTLIQARDEAHRFAITYHRLRKSKKTLEK